MQEDGNKPKHKVFRLIGDRYRIVTCFQVGCGKRASVEVESRQLGTGRLRREYKCGPCLRRWQQIEGLEIEFD